MKTKIRKDQIYQEDPVITNKDWRLQAITTLTKDWVSPWTKTLHPIGTPVSAVTFIKFNKGELTFSLPNMTAMFLDFSWKIWKDTESFLVDEKNFAKTKSKDFKADTIYPTNETLFFDAVEKRMGAVIFAYNALESFCNEQIPDAYVFEIPRKDGRCTERYNKDQIEKFLSLEIKLGELLPKLFNNNLPKEGLIWNDFKNLQDLRDRIVHIKTKDRKSSSAGEKTIWGDILSPKTKNPAEVAFVTISHFLKDQKANIRWYGKFPYQE